MGPGPPVSSLGRGVAAAAGVIAAVTVLSRLAGFVRTLVFADSVRAAGVGEVYNAVNAVPNVLYEVAAGGALAAVAVPLVAGHLGAGRRAEADRVASALLTWALTVLVPLAVLVALLAGPLARWLVGPDVPDGAATGAAMLRVFAWQIPLYGVGVVLAGVLQAHRRFLAAALAPLLSSLVVIATYLAYGSLAGGRTSGVGGAAVALLAWGTTLGVVALSLPLLVPAVRAGWRWRPTWRFPGGEAARARSLAGAGLLALAAQQAAVVVTIWVATHRGGGEGTLSVYTWVQAVYLLPYAVLAVPLATAAFPSLASGATTDVAAAATTLARTARAVVLLSAAGAAVLTAAAPWVGRFFALLDARRGAGSASGAAVAALADGLRAFAPGLVGLAVAAVAVRALYVRGHAPLAAAAAGVGWAVAALGPLLQLRPAATAHSVLVTLGAWSSAGTTVSAVLLVALLARHWGRPALARLGATTLSCTVALLVVGAAALRLADARAASAGLVPTVLTGVLAGVGAGAAFLLLVGVGHRDTLRLLDLRRLRGRSS